MCFNRCFRLSCNLNWIHIMVIYGLIFSFCKGKAILVCSYDANLAFTANKGSAMLCYHMKCLALVFSESCSSLGPPLGLSFVSI